MRQVLLWVVILLSCEQNMDVQDYSNRSPNDLNSELKFSSDDNWVNGQYHFEGLNFYNSLWMIFHNQNDLYVLSEDVKTREH